MCRRIPILVVLCCLIASAGSARADDGLPLKVLDDLKSATAFVKVKIGRLEFSGSGFVIKVAGDDVYVVTNNHVVDPPTTFTAPGRKITFSGTKSISLVFWSGTKAEQIVHAEPVAADSERDLAVLKATGLKVHPQALDLARPAQVAETTPVYVFGFPFGEALSTSHGNPAITVGRGIVSSIRLNDQGNVAAVQIDGALNPGNSGGPVVDGQGRLAGIAVATIRGSGIGMAIPPAELSHMLLGRVGGFKFSAHKGDGGKFTVHVTLRLIDPLNKLKSAGIHWMLTSLLKTDRKNPRLADFPDVKKLDLKIDGQNATGSFEVPVATEGDTSITFQTVYVNGDAKAITTTSRVYVLHDKPPAASPPSTASAPGPAPVAGGEPQPAAPEDLKEVKIPEHAVAGSVHGLEFKPDRVEFQGGWLTLREGTQFFPDLAVRIYLQLKPGEAISGRVFRLNHDKSQYRDPHVRLVWMDKGARLPTDVFMQNYTMVLEFGELTETTLTGKIWLITADDHKSHIEGTFTAAVK